ncbi:hypothetical protein GALMADRAFT_220820 [Galerina marginata CBS 339.88]|uniref:Nucleoside diphosphate kinase n=1 Tax=Galerina marginata (strain CBS 339.88) TaxID=685588 RepID=A0A067THV8_GALM3|nr:hypothetical protein GALMADRAFT_220820 [Galerina marginata CBS 339.88]
MPTPPSHTPDVYEHEEVEVVHELHGHEVEEEELDGTRTPEPLGLQTSTSSLTSVTRTVAIIKPHALAHRFDIEKRIQEASFEIVKERQMEFDTETDPDTLYELFGEDADALAEGPVWVYVLERRRAVEVWNTLMGDRDLGVARRESPNSLRALYGLSTQQNGLMGSSDTHIAEIQISSLFASSPPFPTTDLPSDDTDRYGSMRSIDSGVLESIRKSLAGEDEGYAPSSNPSTAGGGKGRLHTNGKVLFKARGLPATHGKPDIVPRTTRAAALRAGVPVEKVLNTPRAPVSKERLAQTFANVPGHKRASTISVASTAAPVIAPRMTRAASLRLGQPAPPPAIRRRALTNEEQTKHGLVSTFEGVPGYKRRESIAVASMKAPTVAPRLNKSAALRAQKDQAPPTSFMFRGSSATKTPTLSRANSSQPIGSPQKAPLRPASQASGQATPSRYAVPRASSAAAVRPAAPSSSTAARPIPKPKLTNGHARVPTASSSTTDAEAADEAAAPTPTAPAAAAVKPKPKPRPSSIAAPNIQPRTNRSAALRAAKQEAENAAAAAAAARKTAPRPSKVAPPSSFKAIPA